jgi:hypothetical protein
MTTPSHYTPRPFFLNMAKNKNIYFYHFFIFEDSVINDHTTTLYTLLHPTSPSFVIEVLR